MTPARLAISATRPPGYGIFFYSIHGPFEWVLVPWVLIVNWHHPARRRLLVVAAVIFYLGRLASALYFAPNAIHWGENPAEAAGQFDELALWIRLDLIRVILQDALVAVLLLVIRSTGVRQDPVRRTGGAAIPR